MKKTYVNDEGKARVQKTAYRELYFNILDNEKLSFCFAEVDKKIIIHYHTVGGKTLTEYLRENRLGILKDKNVISFIQYWIKRASGK